MAFTTEAEVYAAMGLNPEETPTEEPAAQETPAEQTPSEEPAAEETPTEEPTPREEVEPPAGGDGGEDPLEKLRRELTEQHKTEMEKLRQQHKAEDDKLVAGMGLKNPYNGNKLITTKEELDEYQKVHDSAQWDNIAKQAGMSQEQLDKLIAQRPEVRKALESQAQAEQQKLRAKLDEEIAAIAAECPEVTNIDSLVSHPSYPAVAEKMRQYKNMGVAEAFRLVNYKALAEGRANANAQRVRNNLAGKGHMVPSGSRGGGAPTMSREQEAMYRRLLPNASRAEILKFHQENMKGESK